LIVASIFIVIGLAVFLPNLAWNWYWGTLWLMIGGLIVGAYALRRTGKTSTQPQSVTT
jgi:F0F1-type ATP synthase assembly protein I